jgi:hypothetical protein
MEGFFYIVKAGEQSSTLLQWDGLLTSKSTKSRATVRAVSRSLPTAGARVRARVRSCGQSVTAAGFLRVLKFPPSNMKPIAPHLSSSRGWYNRTNNARRDKWAQSYPTPGNERKLPQRTQEIYCLYFILMLLGALSNRNVVHRNFKTVELLNK